MCDYSLESQVSRDAKVGDRLVTSEFSGTMTRGFCAQGAPGVAVCLRPGTEIAFDKPIEAHGLWALPFHAFWRARPHTAVFRQINTETPGTHHDALELADGNVILLTNLRKGQTAAVLQLPADPTEPRERNREEASPALEAVS
jgi:hypothetical protein